MMNQEQFFIIFDAAIGVLGIYLAIISRKCLKDKTVHTMLVPAEEQMKCKDVEGMSKYLMPKTFVFGIACIIFGIVGFIHDFGIVDLTKIGNAALLVGFFIVWCVFTFFLRKAKKLYIR